MEGALLGIEIGSSCARLGTNSLPPQRLESSECESEFAVGKPTANMRSIYEGEMRSSVLCSSGTVYNILFRTLL